MTELDLDRCRLLHGPYRAPELRRGDSATCLFRDRDVVVTGLSEAPLSWPRCLPIGRRGHPSLLVEEELARAIRHESAAAIGYWWGVSEGVVWRWRRAFGIGRADTEGSRRLVQAAAKAGAEAMQAKVWTEEEREVRRQQAI